MDSFRIQKYTLDKQQKFHISIRHEIQCTGFLQTKAATSTHIRLGFFVVNASGASLGQAGMAGCTSTKHDKSCQWRNLNLLAHGNTNNGVVVVAIAAILGIDLY